MSIHEELSGLGEHEKRNYEELTTLLARFAEQANAQGLPKDDYDGEPDVWVITSSGFGTGIGVRPDGTFFLLSVETPVIAPATRLAGRLADDDAIAALRSAIDEKLNSQT